MDDPQRSQPQAVSFFQVGLHCVLHVASLEAMQVEHVRDRDLDRPVLVKRLGIVSLVRLRHDAYGYGLRNPPLFVCWGPVPSVSARLGGAWLKSRSAVWYSSGRSSTISTFVPRVNMASGPRDTSTPIRPAAAPAASPTPAPLPTCPAAAPAAAPMPAPARVASITVFASPCLFPALLIVSCSRSRDSSARPS